VAHKKIQGAGSVIQRRQLLDEENSELPRKRQCELLSLHRSGTYYKPRAKADETPIEKALNELYIKDPCLSLRKLPDMVERHYGIKIGAKKIARIRRDMRIKTIYRHPKTSAPGKRKEGPRPYLLKSLQTIDVDKVWSSDITYLQIGPKNYYLCVVLDWASREVLGWSLSDNMNTQLCLEALDMAFSIGRKPEIFNTDQGSQYTSHDWLRELEERGISISMDGKGRWADNIAVERFWRTYKHDSFLLNEVNSLEEARRLTAHWLTYYNRERPHARLGNLSPSEYCRQKGYPPAANFLRDFSAPMQLASLRSAPSLRSGRCIYATKSRKKWIDRPHCIML